MSELTPTGQLALENVLSSVASQPKPELGFEEGIAAAYDAAELNKSNFFGKLVSDPLVKSLTRYSELTGERPPANWDGMSSSMAEANLAWLDQRQGIVERLLKDTVGPPDPFLKSAETIRQEAAATKRDAMEKASRAGWVASLGGSIASGITDPINIMLLPAGLFAAEGVLATAAIEATIGGAAGYAIEKAAQPGNIQLGMGKTEEEMQQSAFYSAAFSGLFGGGIKALAKVNFPEVAAKYANREAGVAADAAASTDHFNASNTVADAGEILPHTFTNESQSEFIKYAQSAVDVVRETDPRMQGSYTQRLNESLVRLQESVSRGITEAGNAMLEAEVPIRDIGRTKGTTFARSIAKPTLQEQLGVEVRYSRNPDGSVVLESRDPNVPFEETFQANTTWREARAQLDRLTERLGIEKAPLTNKEQTVMKSLHLWDEYIKRADTLDKAKAEFSRRVEDKIVEVGGKPFESKRKLRAYAEQSGITDYSFEKMGNGWAIKPNNPYDVPGYYIDQVSEPSIRSEYADKRVAETMATESPAEAKVVEPEVTVDSPDIGSAANSELIKNVQELRSFAEANTDAVGFWIDANGNETVKPLSEILKELDAEDIELTDTINCIIG